MAKTTLGLLAVFCAFATTSASASLPFAPVHDAFAPRVPRRPAARLLALNEMQAHPSSDAAATSAAAASMADPNAPARAPRRHSERRRTPAH